jgi:hypothetical protein
MFDKSIKIIFSIIVTFVVSSNIVQADILKPGIMANQQNAFIEKSGYVEAVGHTALTGTIALVINTFLSLLGIIFVILVLWAGYNWMTAGGDETKVTKAKATISRAIIGLIIIVAAYAITYFVFHALESGNAINSSTNPSEGGSATPL